MLHNEAKLKFRRLVAAGSLFLATACVPPENNPRSLENVTTTPSFQTPERETRPVYENYAFIGVVKDTVITVNIGQTQLLVSFLRESGSANTWSIEIDGQAVCRYSEQDLENRRLLHSQPLSDTLPQRAHIQCDLSPMGMSGEDIRLTINYPDGAFGPENEMTR